MSAVRIAFEISSTFRETSPGLNAEQARTEVATRAEAQGAVLSKAHGPRAEVSTIDLPCGQATLVLRQSPDLRMPAEFTASEEDIPVDVAQLQAFIPVPQSVVPGAQTLVTVTFSTPARTTGRTTAS